MVRKSDEEIYKYVLDYKNKLKDEYNNDQDKLFDKSNQLKLHLSGQLIAFSSLLIPIGSGYLLSNPDLDSNIKNFLVISLFLFAFSIIFGFLSHYFASEFWLKWARNVHEKGGMVYHDSSKTVEELETLLNDLKDKDNEMPLNSNRITTIIQTAFFILGLGLILVAILKVAYP